MDHFTQFIIEKALELHRLNEDTISFEEAVAKIRRAVASIQADLYSEASNVHQEQPDE